MMGHCPPRYSEYKVKPRQSRVTGNGPMTQGLYAKCTNKHSTFKYINETREVRVNHSAGNTAAGRALQQPGLTKQKMNPAKARRVALEPELVKRHTQLLTDLYNDLRQSSQSATGADYACTPCTRMVVEVFQESFKKVKNVYRKYKTEYKYSHVLINVVVEKTEDKIEVKLTKLYMAFALSRRPELTSSAQASEFEKEMQIAGEKANRVVVASRFIIRVMVRDTLDALQKADMAEKEEHNRAMNEIRNCYARVETMANVFPALAMVVVSPKKKEKPVGVMGEDKEKKNIELQNITGKGKVEGVDHTIATGVAGHVKEGEHKEIKVEMPAPRCPEEEDIYHTIEVAEPELCKCLARAMGGCCCIFLIFCMVIMTLFILCSFL